MAKVVFEIQLPSRNRRSGMVAAIHMRHGNASVTVPTERQKRRGNRARRKAAERREIRGE